MTENLDIKADKEPLFDYIKKFQEGKIQVPAFQRDFVWDNEKKLQLFDSIKLGYPIGSVLLWRPDFKTDEDFYKFESERIGSYSIPERHSDYFYILDGYQRLSTLFGCLVNPNKTELVSDEKERYEKFNIIYNLEDDEFETTRKKNTDLEYFKVPIYKLIDPKEFFQFQRQLAREQLEEERIEDFLEKYENISKIFQSYNLPSITIYGGSVTDAIDIFQRLNSRGAPITNDWVVSALSFNKDRNFKLGDIIDNLLEDLKEFNFENQKREVILQCITNSFGVIFFDKAPKGKKLEELAKRSDFIDVTNKTIKSIKKAVEFLYKEQNVIDGKLLPYNSQLIFITDFFNRVESVTPKQLEQLKKWFWITTYSNYFTIYNLSKQRLAYGEFQKFINDENHNPIYYDKGRFETLEFPLKITMGSVRAKALALFMLKYQLFKTNIKVSNIDNYRFFKLFSDFGKNKEDSNLSENIIVVIDEVNSLTNFEKSLKDLSCLLESLEDYSYFFISKEMQTAFRKGTPKEDILRMRKELIMENEKNFVERLDIKYETID